MSSPESAAVVAAATTLSATLWRLREALDHLLFKVFETRLVLATGEERWLPNAGRELDAARRETSELELVRAVETVTLGDRLRLPATATLSELSRELSPPWDTIFADHRDALRALTVDIGRAVTGPQPEITEPSALTEVGDVRGFVVDALLDARPASLLAFLA